MPGIRDNACMQGNVGNGCMQGNRGACNIIMARRYIAVIYYKHVNTIENSAKN